MRRSQRDPGEKHISQRDPGDNGSINFHTQLEKMHSILDQLAKLHREELDAVHGTGKRVKFNFNDECASSSLGDKESSRWSVRRKKPVFDLDIKDQEYHDIICSSPKHRESTIAGSILKEGSWIPQDEHLTIHGGTNEMKLPRRRLAAVGQSTEDIQLEAKDLAVKVARVSGSDGATQDNPRTSLSGSSLGSEDTMTTSEHSGRFSMGYVMPSGSLSFGVRKFRLKSFWSQWTHLSDIPLKLIVATRDEPLGWSLTQSNAHKVEEDYCVLHPESKIRTLWTMLSMCYLLYDVIMVPFVVCFEPLAGIFSYLVDVSSTVFFTIDIPMNFITGVRSYEYVEMKLHNIAHLYLKSWFIFDLMIVLPDWITFALGAKDSEAGHVSMLRLLRWTRFMRLLRVARVMKSVETRTVVRRIAFYFRLSKAYVMVTKGCIRVSALLLMLVHFAACLWFALGKNIHHGWVQVNGYAGVDVGTSYVVSVRWTFGRLHGYMTNLEVETWTEMLVDAVLVYCSLILVCIYVSSMTTVWTTSVASRPWSLWNAKVDFVQRHNISSDLSHKVQKALETVGYAGAGEIAEEEQMLLESLPESLQKDLLFEARRVHLVSKPFFKDLALFNQRAMWHICNAATVSQVIIREETVFAHAEACSRMILVETGKLLYKYGPERPMGPPGAAVSICDPVNYGDNVSEAALWTAWEHKGFLLAHSESSILSIDAIKFGDTVSQQEGPCVLGVRYAKHFVWRLNREDEPSDLTQFSELNYETLDEDTFEGTDQDHFVFISHYKNEAGTEATLIRDLMTPMLRNDPAHVASNLPSPVFIDSEDLSDLARIKEHVIGSCTLLILLTPGVFTRPWCLVELVVAIRNEVNLLPVEVQRPGMKYQYPDEGFYEDMLKGKVVDKAGVELLTSEGIQLEEAVDAVRQVFLKIAVPFSPHRSKDVREAELNMILKRCRGSTAPE